MVDSIEETAIKLWNFVPRYFAELEVSSTGISNDVFSSPYDLAFVKIDGCHHHDIHHIRLYTLHF